MKLWLALAAGFVGCGAPPIGDGGASSTGASTAIDESTSAASGAASATTGDMVCDATVTACTGAQVWLQAFPVSSDPFFGEPIEAAALAVAPDGDIVVTGMYGGTIDFAGESIASIGALDIWVARFGPDGAPRWFHRFGGPDPTPDQGYGGANYSVGNITFDTDGDILLSANAMDTIDFGFGPLVGEDLDPVVVRLSPSGQPRWARRHVGLGGGFSEFPVLIAPVGDGRFWLAGTLFGPGVDLGGGVLDSAGWGDVVIAQFDGDGNYLWSRRAGDPGHQETRAIAAAPDGGLVIAGGLEGSLDLGAGLLVSAGGRDAFVAHLDHAGEATWSHRYGDNSWETSLAVQVDADGGVLLVGEYYGDSLDLGGGALDANAPLFFAGLAADGAHVWSTGLRELMTTLDRGADGTLVLTGFGASTLMWPGGVLGRGEGPWVATLGPRGTPRWQRILANDESSVARAVAGPDGAAVVAFTLRGEAEFDGGTIGAADKHTFVVAQFGL